jgi:HEAT repeats
MTLRHILLLGIVLTALYLAVMLQLFIVRFTNSVKARRRERIDRDWLPLLAAEDDAPELPLPELQPRDIVPFLTLWNQLQESFVGDIKTHLNTVGTRIGIEGIAHRLLARRRLSDRLIAISTLGHLRDHNSWDVLVRLTSHEDGLLSLAAARALTRIDHAAALPVILPLAASRDDWSRNYVLGMLSDLGADIVSRPLTEAALSLPPDSAHRLVQYFTVAHVGDAVPVVRTIIGRTRNVECIAACLRAFADVDQLDTVRDYLQHPAWQVRVQAVNVLGRLGSGADARAILPLLSDSEWWVRYRAAKALCVLPDIELSSLRRLSTQHQDPFARDMLVHVLAEAKA